MLHIVQHPKTKKFELVAVSKNGNYLMGSKQGYEKKQAVYKAIRSLIKDCFVAIGGADVLVQDDTTTESGVWAFSLTERKFMPDVKPKPKYILNKKY
jgi:uncharacterized protein YegP (UPF0339 family)